MPHPSTASDTLTGRLRERHAENIERDAAMTVDERAAEARRLHGARIESWRILATHAARAGYVADAARLTREATQLARSVPTVGPAGTPTARPRGAGRPARRAGASSRTSSADPGEHDPELLPVVTGSQAPSTAHEAVARTFERILTDRQPGVSWTVEASR